MEVIWINLLWRCTAATRRESSVAIVCLSTSIVCLLFVYFAPNIEACILHYPYEECVAMMELKGVNWRKVAWLSLAWLILASCTVECWQSYDKVTYSRLELLQLQGNRAVLPSPALLTCVPKEIQRQPEVYHLTGRTRKRGRKGGVRQRMRRAAKLSLPPILLCNARSLKKKLDELRTLAKMPTPPELQAKLLTVFTYIFKISLMQQCW